MTDTVSDEEFDEIELGRRRVTEIILDALDDLRERCAAAEGVETADAWRASIDGVCLSERGVVTCVTISGEQIFDGHWLIPHLNERVRPRAQSVINETGTRMKVFVPRAEPRPEARTLVSIDGDGAPQGAQRRRRVPIQDVVDNICDKVAEALERQGKEGRKFALSECATLIADHCKNTLMVVGGLQQLIDAAVEQENGLPLWARDKLWLRRLEIGDVFGHRDVNEYGMLWHKRVPPEFPPPEAL